MKKDREAAAGQQLVAPGYCFKEPLTVEEAAAFTGMAVGTLYNLVHQTDIAFYKPFGEKGKTYFKRSELESFLFRNRTPANYEVSGEADALLNGEIWDGQ